MLGYIKRSSIRSQLLCLMGTVLVVFVVAYFFIINKVEDLTVSYNRYVDVVVEYETSILRISRDVNYTSRLGRSVFLGDDYEKNSSKLKAYIKQIEEEFAFLQNTVNPKIDEPEFRSRSDELLINSRKATLAFLGKSGELIFGLSERVRTPELLQNTWEEYSLVASPLANESREHFHKLIEYSETEGERIKKKFSYDIDQLDVQLTYIIFSGVGIVFFLFFAIISLILRQINTFGDLVQKGIEEKDLTIKIPFDNVSGVFGSLSRHVNELFYMFKETSGNLSEISKKLISSSERIRNSATDTTNAIVKQKDELENISVSMEEFTTTINTISENANNAALTASSSLEESSQGKDNAEKTVCSMDVVSKEMQTSSRTVEQLNENSKQIASISDVIKGIADQTNLLALNAAIEAARAGETGRGFSVVADEVRSLATKTHQSTEEIEHRISELSKDVDKTVSGITKTTQHVQESVESVVEMNNSLTNIDSSIKEITILNEQIATGSTEQSQVIADINTRVSDLNDEIFSVLEKAKRNQEINQSASVENLELAQELKRLAEQFRH